MPGVSWGAGFPDGWRTHHPDEWTHLINAEKLINPSEKPRWDHPYPEGMAAMVAVPMIALRIVRGEMDAPLPSPQAIITAGRIVSVLYGTATIVVLMLIGRRLFAERRVSIVAGWILALGGLHVTQSHFFLSDAPSVFWILLGLYLLMRDLEGRGRAGREYLMWAAFCFGAGFGMKLVVAGLPSLAVIALLRSPRLMRVTHSIMFFLAGFVVINFGSYTAADFYKTLHRGVGDPNYHFSRLSSACLYLAELPSIVSLPVLILAVIGAVLLAKRALAREIHNRLHVVVLIVLLPLIAYAYFVLFKVSHFPRHVVPLIPWICLSAAWCLVRAWDALARRAIHPAVLVGPFFAYLLLFVYDGERIFLQEPRNTAAKWVLDHVEPGTQVWFDSYEGLAGYDRLRFPEDGRPPVLLIEMMSANHYLSGLGLRDSMPRDYRRVFDGQSQERIDALQAVFRGESEYAEVARFEVGYFMPEFRLMDRWFGDRSRNYLTDVVVFRRSHDAKRATPTAG